MSDLHEGPPSKKRLTGILLVVFLSLIVLVLSLTVIFRTASTTQDVRQTQLETTPFGKKIAQSVDNIAAVLALLQDCLNPEGECGKRSTANQERILKRFHEDAITAAACADKRGRQTRAEIVACVDKHGS